MLLSWIFLHLLQVFVYARSYANLHYSFLLLHISVSCSSYTSITFCNLSDIGLAFIVNAISLIESEGLSLSPTILNIFSFIFFINEIVTRCYYFCCNCRNNIIIDYLVIVIKELPPPTFIVFQYVRKSCIHKILISLVDVHPLHRY